MKLVMVVSWQLHSRRFWDWATGSQNIREFPVYCHETRQHSPHQMDDDGLVTSRSAATLPTEARTSAEAAKTLLSESRTISRISTGPATNISQRNILASRNASRKRTVAGYMSPKRMWVLEEQDDLGDGKDKGDKCQG